MYRHRLRTQILYGHFAQALAVWEKINEVSRDRGWREATFWVPTVGRANELLIETEYLDLATFEKENAAFYSDPEAMKLFRETAGHAVQDSTHDELYQEAPHLA